ncbi:hypothetical protein D3C71_1903580 [compost metagenome]
MPEGQLVWISTQSDIAPRGFWKDELTKARAVRDGTLHLPGYAPILYEPPPGMGGGSGETMTTGHAIPALTHRFIGCQSLTFWPGLASTLSIDRAVA